VNPRVAGSHGDLAQALALAVLEHDRVGVPVRARMASSTASMPEPGSLVRR
jgi:hypothetical protein